MKVRYLDNFKISILLLCALVVPYSFICMTKNCFSAAMVFIVDEGYMTKFQTGAIVAAFYIVYAILQIVGGIVTDRWKPERLIVIGLFGSGVANLLIYFLYKYYAAVMLIWIFNAAIQFGVWPATFKLITTLLHRKINMIGITIATFSYPLGTVVGYLVAAVVKRWQDSFLISAVGLFFFAALVLFLFRAVSPMLDVREETEVKYPSEKSERRGFIGLIFSSGLVFIIAVNFIRNMLDNGLKTLTPSMIKESYIGLTPDFSTILSIVVLVAGVLGPVVAQMVFPRLISNEVVAFAIFFGCSIPFCAVLIFIGKISYWVIILSTSMIVLCTSGAGLFSTSFIATRFNKWGKGATVAGILNCLACLGIATANLCFTRLADSVGWRAIAVISVALLAGALILSLLAVPLWTKFKKTT